MNELQLRIEAIKRETANAVTFYLKEISGKKVTYQAGQFITLIIIHHGEEVRRSYSLSSSPDEELLAVTVKRIENGEVTRLLLSYTKIGDVWNAVMPAGRFTPSVDQHDKDIFYFAAGSGITPIYAHLKYLLAGRGNSRIHLIYSNQSERDILFRAELDAMQQQHPERLHIIHLLSSHARRLNNLMVEQLVKRESKFAMEKAEFYLCGPFDYMRMIQLTLLYMGFEQPQIHKENFVLETVPVTSSITNFPPKKVDITISGETHHIIAGENQSILQAALQSKIQLPYSCRNGVCSSCIAKCISGKVEMVKNEVLTNAELAQGWILTCTGYALTDDVAITYPTAI